MLEIEGLNYWAVLVAWFITCALGAFWYSPMAFAKHWHKQTGIDILKIPEKEATKILVSVALSAVAQALAMAVVINSLNVTTAMDGLMVGVVLWLGFTAATAVGVTLYSRRSWSFWWLNSSYFLLVMSINSILLAVWH